MMKSIQKTINTVKSANDHFTIFGQLFPDHGFRTLGVYAESTYLD